MGHWKLLKGQPFCKGKCVDSKALRNMKPDCADLKITIAEV